MTFLTKRKKDRLITTLYGKVERVSTPDDEPEVKSKSRPKAIDKVSMASLWAFLEVL